MPIIKKICKIRIICLTEALSVGSMLWLLWTVSPVHTDTLLFMIRICVNNSHFILEVIHCIRSTFLIKYYAIHTISAYDRPNQWSRHLCSKLIQLFCFNLHNCNRWLNSFWIDSQTEHLSWSFNYGLWMKQFMPKHTTFGCVD